MRIAKAAPAPHRALVALSKSVELDPTLRELVNLRASIVNGCAYYIDTHTKEARQAGESEQRLYALAAWRDAPHFSDRERAALALTDAITRSATSTFRAPSGTKQQRSSATRSSALGDHRDECLEPDRDRDPNGVPLPKTLDSGGEQLTAPPLLLPTPQEPSAENADPR